MVIKVNFIPRTRTDYLVVHCSATQPLDHLGADDIDRWHREKGWVCIGYHYVIRTSGTIEAGRDVRAPGAHAVQVNDRAIGICMIGGVDKGGHSVCNYTEAQFAALKGLLQRLRVDFPYTDIIGHRDIPGVAKDCPCFDVREWCKQESIRWSRPAPAPKK